MKILSVIFLATLGVGSAAHAITPTCTIPEGEYKEKCKDIRIQGSTGKQDASTDKHGISVCKLTATCQLPPGQRSGWVASSLDLDLKDVGSNASCLITVNDKGQLTCEKKE